MSPTDVANIPHVTPPHAPPPEHSPPCPAAQSSLFNTSLLEGTAKKDSELKPHLGKIHEQKHYLKAELLWPVHPGLGKAGLWEKEKIVNGHMCRGEGWEAKMEEV